MQDMHNGFSSTLRKNTFHKTQSIGIEDIPEKQPREWIIDNYLPVGSLILISGEQGTGKSKLIQQWVASVTCADYDNDVYWNGNGVTGGKVLYVALEDDIPDIFYNIEELGGNVKRLRCISTVVDDKPTLQFHAEKPIELPLNLDFLFREIEHVQPSLVVIDTIGAAMTSNDTRKQNEIAIALRSIAANTGITFLLVSHLKSGYYRTENIQSRLEHKTISARSRISYLVAKEYNGKLRGLITIKCNIEVNPPPYYYTIVTLADGRLKIETANSSKPRLLLGNNTTDTTVSAKIIEALTEYGCSTPTEIAQYTSENLNSIKGTLARMLKDNILTRNTRGYYEIATILHGYESSTANRPTEDTKETDSSTEKGTQGYKNDLCTHASNGHTSGFTAQGYKGTLPESNVEICTQHECNTGNTRQQLEECLESPNKIIDGETIILP